MARTIETITYKGETRTYTEWAAVLGIARSTLHDRITKRGWDVERAFTEPVDSSKSRHNGKPVQLPDIRPKSMTLVEASIACKLAGLDYGKWHYLCEVLGLIEPPTAEEIAANTHRKKRGRPPNVHKDCPVTAYDLEGRPVMTYPSVTVAAKAIGKNTGGIYACIGGRYTRAYGYQWRYADEPAPEALPQKKSAPTTAPKTEKVCIICGTVFMGNKKETLCSPTCRDEARKRRMRDYGKRRRAEAKKARQKINRKELKVG